MLHTAVTTTMGVEHIEAKTMVATVENKPRDVKTWAKQTEEGRAVAGELLDLMVAKECPPMLGWALKEMIAKGEFGGLEVGFAQKIAERLMSKG